MTLQDFAESVVAGWLPLTFRPCAHVLCVAWGWFVDNLLNKLLKGVL